MPDYGWTGHSNGNSNQLIKMKDTAGDSRGTMIHPWIGRKKKDTNQWQMMVIKHIREYRQYKGAEKENGCSTNEQSLGCAGKVNR